MTAGTAKDLLQHLAAWDEELYRDVVGLSILPSTDNEKKEDFVSRVDKFLQELSSASYELSDIDDRSWLTDTAAKWQKALSALNVPRAIKVYPPKLPLEPPPSPSDYL